VRSGFARLHHQWRGQHLRRRRARRGVLREGRKGRWEWEGEKRSITKEEKIRRTTEKLYLGTHTDMQAPTNIYRDRYIHRYRKRETHRERERATHTRERQACTRATRGAEYPRAVLMGAYFPCRRSSITTPRSFANGVFPTVIRRHSKKEK
jgi:hypothetical protein